VFHIYFLNKRKGKQEGKHHIIKSLPGARSTCVSLRLPAGYLNRHFVSQQNKDPLASGALSSNVCTCSPMVLVQYRKHECQWCSAGRLQGCAANREMVYIHSQAQAVLQSASWITRTHPSRMDFHFLTVRSALASGFLVEDTELSLSLFSDTPDHCFLYGGLIASSQSGGLLACSKGVLQAGATWLTHIFAFLIANQGLVPTSERTNT
jgi:hypothetical protein